MAISWQPSRGRRDARVRLRKALVPKGALAATGAALVCGCSGVREAPQTLVDGSRAPTPTVELHDANDPVVVSRVRASRARDVESGSRLASCLDDAWSEPPVGAIVHRVGVYGESVSFRGRSRRSLGACDAVGSARAGTEPWCGHASGLLTGGRLRDPRLQLGGCTTSDARPVAFAWVEPGRRTRYVLVAQRGFSEAYETSSGLAVRVATTEHVDLEMSRASFSVSEYDADGQRLRAYELEAIVSG
jgi:hypothetical protein